MTISLIKRNPTLFAGRKRMNRRKRGAFSRIERSYGVFERSFTLPVTVKSDAIEARFNDGILIITLPKKGRGKRKGN
jgi:HSP20 family protein